jgi:hypothetical protein
MAFWRISCFLILLAACKNTAPAPEPVPGDTEEKPTREVAMLAVVDHLRLRDQPDSESEVRHSLREGEVVFWTGDASVHKTTISLRGREVSAPWYEVVTGRGVRGWVFSGGLEPWPPGRGLPYQECLEAFRQADFSGFYPCLDRVSHTLSGPEKVAVTPDHLRLRLANGEHRQFNHQRSPGPDYRLYQYLGLITASEAHVLKVNMQGGSSFMLVSRQNGQILDVSGIPQTLPATRSLFCLGSQPGDPGNYTLQIIQPDARQWKVALEQQFPGQSLASLSWGENGLPEISLRDHQGSLVRWNLIRKSGDQWDLDRVR